jgi:transposase-like protein
VLEAEMTEALGAEKGERAAGRQGYRSGYYGRTLITRVGKPSPAYEINPLCRA